MRISGSITYTRKKQIGVGQGMNSMVWLAHDPQLGGEIAVKEIPKSKFGDVNAYFTEAQTLFAVSHPNIVSIQCAFQSKSLICLAMPYYKRGSLKDRTEKGPLTVREAIRVGKGVLAGLSSIHARDFVHFDIKPSNVLFSASHEPLVADFGQSKLVGPTGFTARPGMYADGIPPECYRGIGSKQSDVYHAGLLLYRCVNGDDHFKCQVPPNLAEATRLTQLGKFPDRNKFLPHVPKRLKTIIRKALAIELGERYETVSDLSDALSAVTINHD
jgi:serine/threonine protein kinase